MQILTITLTKYIFFILLLFLFATTLYQQKNKTMKTINIFSFIATLCIFFTACNDPAIVSPGKCNTPDIETGQSGFISFSKENNYYSSTDPITTSGKTFTYIDCKDSTFAVILHGKYYLKHAASGKTTFVFKNKHYAEQGGTFYVANKFKLYSDLDSNEVFITNSLTFERTAFITDKNFGRSTITVDDNIIMANNLRIVSANYYYYFTITEAFIPF